MFKNITENYSGGDASIEILLMLTGALVLGWLLRWLYDYFVYDDVYAFDDPSFAQEGGDEYERAIVEAPAAATQDAVPAPVVAPAVAVMPYKQDDLKIIEGIGPKIEQLLQDNGIDGWQTLADTPVEDIKAILRGAGERYRIHDPSTWPEQSQMAANHQWDELEEFQDFLSGGKIVG